MVVGSGALLIHGLALGREPHDVDIEVCCEDESVLKVAADLYGNDFYKNKEDYPEVGEHKPYIFTIRTAKGNILVNAWAVKRFSHPYDVEYNGVKYAPIQSVLERKMLYGRAKDYRDLNFIIGNLLKIANADKVSLLQRIAERKGDNKQAE